MVTASIFLPSYNKKGFVLEAIQSVLWQSCGDWELWLLENSTDSETREIIKNSGLLEDSRIKYQEIEISQEIRERVYPTAWLLNKYYPQANGDLIFYLSDDDLFEYDCVEACASYLESNPDHSVCYFSIWITGVDKPGGKTQMFCHKPAKDIRRSGEIEGSMDTGRIAHRKLCLEKIPYPFFQEDKVTAYRSDGVFMEALARHYAFYPIPRLLATHRFTPVSCWNYYDTNGKMGETRELTQAKEAEANE